MCTLYWYFLKRVINVTLSVLKQKSLNANVGTGPQTLNMMLNNQGQPSLTLGGKGLIIRIYCTLMFL